jgi:DNA-binding YbaB/EbfC family protein
MFDNMRALASLMGNMPKIREEMEKFQARLPQLVGEGDAGAGMVKVRVNGRMEVLSMQINESALKLNDREMLEDLLRAATNQALEKTRQLVAEETNKMAGSLGLPPGMQLPGMG